MASAIRDLVFLYELDNSIPTAGGLFAQVSVSAYSDPTLSIASVESIAIGDITVTTGLTTTSSISTVFLEQNHAEATGTAFVQTGPAYIDIISTEISTTYSIGLFMVP